MRFTVEVTGLRDLEARLSELSRASGKAALRRAGIKSMQPMAEIARALAPDDPATPPPDDLKSSIAVSSKMKAGRSSRRAAEGRSSVNVYMGPTKSGYPQAIMQEFGTIHHAPQPYMRPAWDQDHGAMLERLKSEMWAEVLKTIRRAEKRAARAAAKVAK